MRHNVVVIAIKGRRRGALRWLLVLAAAAIGSGCARSPKLVPYEAQEYERIFDAPMVIVGTLLSDAAAHSPVLDQGYPIQLRKLKVRVENALRGNVASGEVLVYYFAPAGPYQGNRPLGRWLPDERRILWLRSDSGVLRTASDFKDECTMPVRSGAHPHYKPDSQKPLGCALADIWFTRGDGTTDADFAKGVDWGAPSTVPEPYLFEKLQRLAATEVPVVRDAACKQLSYYRQKCVVPAGQY
jgi:hypothetical protein